MGVGGCSYAIIMTFCRFGAVETEKTLKNCAIQAQFFVVIILTFGKCFTTAWVVDSFLLGCTMPKIALHTGLLNEMMRFSREVFA